MARKARGERLLSDADESGFGEYRAHVDSDASASVGPYRAHVDSDGDAAFERASPYRAHSDSDAAFERASPYRAHSDSDAAFDSAPRTGVRARPAVMSITGRPRDAMVHEVPCAARKRLNEFDLATFRPKELEKRFVRMCPLGFERCFRRFDDMTMYWAQRFRGKFVFVFNLVINALLAIETGAALPFVLYMVGQDSVAGELAFLLLLTALGSQIPKRFAWRYRPFMQNRAFMVRKDLTSSFPSRAVTCGVVYPFAVCYVVLHNQLDADMAWWMPVLVTLWVPLAAYSRMQYGCHFASDCMFGALQGLVYATLATAINDNDLVGCTSCAYNRCYAASEPMALTFATLWRANWPMYGVTTAIGVVLTIVSLVPPIRFWEKCHHMYGMLLPCIAFQLTFLCPGHQLGEPAADGYAFRPSLSMPGAPPFWAVFVGIVVAAGASVAGIRGRGLFAPVLYGVLYVALFWILVVTRLAWVSGV